MNVPPEADGGIIPNFKKMHKKAKTGLYANGLMGAWDSSGGL